MAERFTYFNEETGRYEVELDKKTLLMHRTSLDWERVYTFGDIIDRLAQYENLQETISKFKGKPRLMLDVFIDGDVDCVEIDYKEQGYYSLKNCYNSLYNAVAASGYKGIKVRKKGDHVYLIRVY